jgi:ribose/xylose/arabinose/galactoside ABC-type transport system permease subunit
VSGGRRVGALLAITVLTAAAGALLSPAFLQLSTATFILQYTPILGVLAVAQALVILSGGPGIDLSVGATLSLTGLAVAALAAAGWPLAAACAAGLALGAALGALNGWLVAIIGVPSLMATLGTMFLYGGLALALTGGAPIGGLPDGFGWLAQGRTFGVPNHVWAVLAPVALAAHVALTRTRAGAHVRAAGCDARAAWLAGVRVRRLRFALYALAGVLAALGAILNLSWFQAARPDAGRGMELLSVTIAVLGGVNIFGGEGRIAGVMAALLLVTTAQAAMQLANIPQAWQLGAVGLLLILSVTIDRGWSALGAILQPSRQANQSD